MAQAADAPEEKKESDVVNFSGSWTLRTSEKLDEFLKSEGWGYIMRKAAAAVSAYQTIVQNEKSIKIKVKNKKGTYEYDAPLDGTQIEYKDMDGDDCTSKTTLSEDGQKQIEVLVKKGKTKTCTRYMENGEMKLKIENEQGKYCIRIFKKD